MFILLTLVSTNLTSGILICICLFGGFEPACKPTCPHCTIQHICVWHKYLLPEDASLLFSFLLWQRLHISTIKSNIFTQNPSQGFYKTRKTPPPTPPVQDLCNIDKTCHTAWWNSATVRRAISVDTVYLETILCTLIMIPDHMWLVLGFNRWCLGQLLQPKSVTSI